MDKSIQTDHPKQNAKPAGNPIKQRIAGMAPTTLAPNDKTLHPRKLTKPPASLQPKRQKLKLPRLRFGDNVDVRAYSIEDPRQNTITTRAKTAADTQHKIGKEDGK